MRDAEALDHMVIEPGAYYIMDRAYNDYARLYRLDQGKAWFVVRAKHNLATTPCTSRPVDKALGLRADQTVRLRDRRTFKKYPQPLRRVTFFDVEQHRRFVFMTNDFQSPASTVAQLYRCRWQIELFFKWIKQHLRIKHFLGTSSNAVHTQLWIAVSVYVLIAIIRKELGIRRTLAEMLEIISVTLFEKTSLFEVFSSTRAKTQTHMNRNQLTLFDF